MALNSLFETIVILAEEYAPSEADLERARRELIATGEIEVGAGR